MSILSTLSIGVQAMLVQQKAIQTTGHNLANVNTPGFSRQRAEVSSAFPLVAAGVSLGQGVGIDGIRSVMDNFLEIELLSLNSTLGFTEAESRALTGAENAFPYTEANGIEAALDGFFGALSDLANNPAGPVERLSLINRTKILGDTLRQTRNTLTTLQSSLDKDLNGLVLRVNEVLPQIATLNRQIATSEAGGQRANDFRDQRQILLQELASLTGATVLEGQDGQLMATAGGLLLVSGERAASLDDSTFSPSGFRLLFHKSPGGASLDATSLFTGGEIGGVLTMRDTRVPGFIGRLDQLAKTLVDQVNTQHALGFDLNGVAGGNFFTPIAAVAGAAGIVQVNSAVTANPNLIAAAQTAAGVPGDNRNALALVNLQTTAIAALGNTTLKDYFLSLVGDVGLQARTSTQSLSFQESLLTQTQVRRDAASGVNLDEEMTKLLQFQRMFEAASLLIRTGDELYQTILGIVR
jgi:flagellar hook-associated protein 1 FlgK